MKKLKQLGRCNARIYETEDSMSIVYYDQRSDHGTMQTVEVSNGFILESYAYIVAIYDRDTNTLYELPRSIYSIEIQKQVSKFESWIIEEVGSFIEKHETAALYAEKPYAIYKGW